MYDIIKNVLPSFGEKGIKRFYTTCLLRNPSAASTPFRISYPSNSSSRPPGMQCTPSWHLLYSVPCAADILANSSLHSGQILPCRRTPEHELRRRWPLRRPPPPRLAPSSTPFTSRSLSTFCLRGDNGGEPMCALVRTGARFTARSPLSLRWRWGGARRRVASHLLLLR